MFNHQNGGSMHGSRVKYLVYKLINNQLSDEELSEVLAGLNNTQVEEEYANVLREYFDEIVSQQNLNDQDGDEAPHNHFKVTRSNTEGA